MANSNILGTATAAAPVTHLGLRDVLGEPAWQRLPTAVRTRFSRLAMSVLVFAAGCASGALLYWLTGFWCLAIPVLIGAVAAFMRLDETAQ